MSSGYKAGPSAKLGQSGTSVLSSQAILPNRFNRRSTPDSEALASSDEETDLVSPLDHLNYTAAATIDAVVGATPTASTHTSQSQQSLSQTRPESRTSNQSQPQPQTLPPKPLRRASWLNDTRQSLVRPWGESLNGASMSPTLSHPSPSAVGAGAELGSASGAPATWSAHATSPANFFNRIHSNTSATSPWGTTMWNTERKEPPSRLSEVLPSPTSAIPPGPTGGLFLGGAGSDNSLSQPPNTARDGLGTSQIPFAIPLHPTPKTYRSQSYSVGQLETDASALTDSLTSPITSSLVGPSLLNGSRSRPIPGLQHRPSRPSMLSEMSSDGGMLGKVKEVDDGDESATDSLQGSLHLSAEAKTIELLTRENAMLRQHASQQYHNRLRPRASTGTAYRLENGHALQESVSEESPDYAIDELDEINNEDASTAAAAKTLNGRRMSEFAAPGSSRPPFSAENRKIESVKRAYWQTSPAGFADISPSRRHSFADIPTRQASISSINETIPPHNTNSHDSQQPGIAEFGLSFGDAHSFSAKSLAAAQSVYGANVSGAPLGTAQIGHQEMLQQHQLALQQQQNHMGSAAVSSYGSSGSAYPSSYSLHTPMFAARPSSPQRGVYGMSQPNRSTPLHIVLFKCARADVFYIQDGTGLTVKPGDLVIVEADRGTDLGTVAVDNVDWVEGRRLKEHYSEEQYKWLMMYSQNAEDAQDGAESGLMASSFELHGGAIGGMGSAGQHHIQEPNAGELKPKLIKRLAQNHEIHALRDKEGNEAKAKRVCMQKVKEHGLKMEILDAEFQMDWKKLTFYYFADAYVNFNPLVTDLFKIYKTRIWMSAINPASFASQPLGFQAPSGIGPGAVGVSRVTSTSERRQPQQGGQISPPPPQSRQQQQQSQQQHQTTQSPLSSNFGYQEDVNSLPPAIGPNGTNFCPLPFPYNYAAHGNIPRASALSYGQRATPSPSDAFSMGYASPADFQRMRSRYSTDQPNIGWSGQGLPPLASNEWLGSFQSLSLNTR